MIERSLHLGCAGGTPYCRAGRGDALILIHGVGMNFGFWAPQIAAFAPERDVVAYDTLGHGGSPPPPKTARLGDYTNQLLDLMDGLAIGHATVIGHSMGALVALDFALVHPERVDAVIAMNAVYRRTPEQRAAVARRAASLDGDGTKAWLQAAVDRWFGIPVPSAQAETAARVGAALAGTDPTGYARAYRLFAVADEAHAGRLDALRMPALFLTGALDTNSSPAMSHLMAAEAPRGCAVILPGERHMMSLVSPAAVNDVIRDFLQDAAVLAVARE